MTTHAWPESLPPASVEWGLERKTVQHQSSITGALQSVDLLGYRWSANVNMPPRARGTSGALEAFFNTLIGGVDRVTLHRMDRPQPLGTMRGSPTLNAAVAQFSNTLVLAGAWDTSRRNLLLRSQELDNAAWTKSGASITANATTAPDGTTTADKLVENSSTSVHTAYQAPAVSANQVNVRSFYLKAAERTWAVVGKFDGVSGGSAYFNLATGTLGSKTADVTSGIEAIGGGWYRCWVSATTQVSATTDRAQVSPATGDGGINYAGDGSSGIYVWGGQLEEVSTPTVYTPTTSAARYASGTLKAGDMLGVGSQLFQVFADAAANSSGVMTITTVNRTRVALSSAASVVWDRPTATFVVQDTSSSFAFNPGHMGASSFRLVEAP